MIMQKTKLKIILKSVLFRSISWHCFRMRWEQLFLVESQTWVQLNYLNWSREEPALHFWDWSNQEHGWSLESSAQDKNQDGVLRPNIFFQVTQVLPRLSALYDEWSSEFVN